MALLFKGTDKQMGNPKDIGINTKDIEWF